MSPRDQQIAVAGLAGIKCGVHPQSGQLLRLVVPPGETATRFGRSVPDYVNSYDAIIPVILAQPGFVPYDVAQWVEWVANPIASPQQYCEALLRTVNLWIDE